MPSAPSYAGLRNPVGTHVQVGKGLVKGALAQAADAIGAETVQVFVGNPRGWAHSAGDPVVDAAFRAACEASGMRVFIHTPYLVNLGSPTPSTYERSVAVGGAQPQAGRGDRRRGRRRAHRLLRRRGHAGRRDAPGPRGPAAGARRARRRTAPVAAARADRRPGPLAVRRGRRPRALPRRARRGTRRSASASTPATSSPPAPRSTSPAAPPRPSTGWSRSAGPGRLRLVHANDSMDVRGAFKDRHQRIGDGHIGLGAFEELFAHPATDGRAVRAGDARLPRRRRPADRAAAEAARDGERRPGPPYDPARHARRCWR